MSSIERASSDHDHQGSSVVAFCGGQGCYQRAELTGALGASVHPLMASKVSVELVDDVDVKPAAETVSFGLDGVQYEIDLSAKNAKALRAALESWVASGRRVGGRRGPAARPKRTAVGPDTAAVRAWAASRGYEVKDRGRIPADVIEAYMAVGN